MHPRCAGTSRSRGKLVGAVLNKVTSKARGYDSYHYSQYGYGDAPAAPKNGHSKEGVPAEAR